MIIDRNADPRKIAEALSGLYDIRLVKLPYKSEVVLDAHRPKIEQSIDALFGDRKDIRSVMSADGIILLVSNDTPGSPFEGKAPSEIQHELTLSLHGSPAEQFFEIGALALEKLDTSQAKRNWPAPQSFDDKIWWAKSSAQDKGFIFEPVVDLANRQIVGLTVETKRLKKGPQAPSRIRDPYFNLDALNVGGDLSCISEALNIALDLFQEGEQGVIWCKTNIAGINEKKTQPYYERELRQIPEPLKDYIGLNLVRVENGTPGSKISETLARVRDLCGMTALSVNPSWKRLETLDFVTVSEMCIVWSDTEAQGMGLDRLIAAGKNIKSYCKARHIPLTALNVDSVDEFDLVRRMGVDRIGGGYITELMDGKVPQNHPIMQYVSGERDVFELDI